MFAIFFFTENKLFFIFNCKIELKYYQNIQYNLKKKIDFLLVKKQIFNQRNSNYIFHFQHKQI